MVIPLSVHSTDCLKNKKLPPNETKIIEGMEQKEMKLLRYFAMFTVVWGSRKGLNK